MKCIIHRDLNEFETAFTKCQVCVTHFYILAFFGYLLKTDHFFWRETFSYPNFNSFMHAEWPNWHPSKSFLVVIDKNNARMLIRLCRRTQNALNGLKYSPFWISKSFSSDSVCHWNFNFGMKFVQIYIY